MQKIALVTGTNRGLGLAFCQQLRDMNYRVIAICRKASTELLALDIEVIEHVDFLKPFQLSLFDNLKLEHIDLLINNAAIGLEDSFDHFDYDMIKDYFLVNTLGPMSFTHALMPYLKAQSKIIFISSRMGSITQNQDGGSYSYRLSKAALNMLGKNLALDFKEREIIIGILSPGQVDTDMLRNVGNLGGREVNEAASMLLAIIDNLSLEESGSYIHITGERLPW